MQKPIIAITATFTAEPIEETLAFWMQELNTPFEIKFAPYNQVFQQLLDPASLLSRNYGGINLVLVRFEDWLKDEDAGQARQAAPSGWCEEIERNARDLAAAVRSAAAHSATAWVLCLCPAASATLADANLAGFFTRMEELLVSEVNGTSGVFVVSAAAELRATYPVAAYEDHHANKLGYVPYTRGFFAALGTVIARKIYAVQSAPHKVIALDCDQTLWKGVCGEDGPLGIEIDAPRRALQEFMVAQHDAGMLICLCSKNNEEDVGRVFDERADMPLKREHLVAWRLNWENKSGNLRSLAEELGLGLESFIFVDDDPVPCAEVEARCPEVLTLRLPPNPMDIPRYLNHVWAFDRLQITEEDKERTAVYKQNIERERFRKEHLSFGDFLASLKLEIKISEIRPEHLARVAQLTQRTNQFNFTTIRRSEAEVQRLCEAGELRCLVLELNDRFGEYGLVGVIMFRDEGEAMSVDTLLLSCRALGRGVEHRMLAKLGEIARERGLDRVDVTYAASGKNRPALDFLESVSAQFKQQIDGGYFFKFPVDFAAAITYSPEGVKAAASRDFPDKRVASTLPTITDETGTQTKSVRLSRIAAELNTAEQILKAIESQKQRTRPELEEAYVAPRTPVEEMLAGIWAQTLGINKVGIHDNFFQMGGHSLLGTLLISRVYDAFQMELALRTLFDSPTVAGLARVVLQGQIERAGAQKIAEALLGLDELSDEDAMALLASDEEAADGKAGNAPCAVALHNKWGGRS